MLNDGSNLQFQEDKRIEEQSFDSVIKEEKPESIEDSGSTDISSLVEEAKKEQNKTVAPPVIDHPPPSPKSKIQIEGTGTDVHLSLDASAGNFPELVNDLKKAVKNKINNLGSGALEFADTKEQIDKAVKTFLARIPDNDAGNKFAQSLDSLIYHSGKDVPAGRTKIASFKRKESIEEIIKGSKVKSEESDIVLYAGIALIGLILLK